MFLPHQLLVKDMEGWGLGTGDIHSQLLPIPVSASEAGKMLRCWLLKVKAREHTT